MSFSTLRRKMMYAGLFRPLYSPGSFGWLASSERRYGGMVTNVPRKISPHESFIPYETDQGGDRMLTSIHSYGFAYAEYLKPHIGAGGITLVEIGILMGTGLATWSDLFPSGRIIGLDFNLENINGNMDNLRRRGAFRRNPPELYEFDQYEDNREFLAQILKGDTIDICIDDACHDSDAIMNTLRDVSPYLSENFTYFVEDNSEVHSRISSFLPECRIERYDEEMTIITRHGR